MCSIAARNRHGPLVALQPVDLSTGDLHELAQGVLGPEATRIDLLGLSKKLEELESRFAIRVSWRDEVNSIVLARNCLTHRLGVVAARDVNDPEARVLRLRLRYHGFHITQPNGATIPLDRPDQIVQAGGTVTLRPGETHERVFRVGERLALSNQEFMRLLTTLNQVGVEVAQGAERSVAGNLNGAGPGQTGSSSSAK
jgi:hypothetical protein